MKDGLEKLVLEGKVAGKRQTKVQLYGGAGVGCEMLCCGCVASGG